MKEVKEVEGRVSEFTLGVIDVQPLSGEGELIIDGVEYHATFEIDCGDVVEGTINLTRPLTEEETEQVTKEHGAQWSQERGEAQRKLRNDIPSFTDEELYEMLSENFDVYDYQDIEIEY